MRGADIQQDSMFSTVIPEQRMPSDHPLRPIREKLDKALKELGADLLSKELFSVDATLIEALASHKSYRPGNAHRQIALPPA